MIQESSRSQPIVSKGRAYYAYILLFLLYMFDYIDRPVLIRINFF
ncbi:MAG: hypothetical protein WC566_12075 [Dehalococcoidia bacterium]